jgi:hypothetical protein
MEVKICSRCKKEKPISEFEQKKSGEILKRCKLCSEQTAQAKLKKKEQPEPTTQKPNDITILLNSDKEINPQKNEILKPQEDPIKKIENIISAPLKEIKPEEINFTKDINLEKSSEILTNKPDNNVKITESLDPYALTPQERQSMKKYLLALFDCWDITEKQEPRIKYLDKLSNKDFLDLYNSNVTVDRFFGGNLVESGVYALAGIADVHNAELYQKSGGWVRAKNMYKNLHTYKKDVKLASVQIMQDKKVDAFIRDNPFVSLALVFGLAAMSGEKPSDEELNKVKPLINEVIPTNEVIEKKKVVELSKK